MVVTGFGVVGVANLVPNSVDPLHAVYGVLGIIGLLAIQLLWFCRPSAQLDSPTSRVLLVVVILLAYLPIPAFGLLWADMPDFVGGAVLLMLPSRYAWPAFAVVCATIAWTTRPTTAIR